MLLPIILGGDFDDGDFEARQDVEIAARVTADLDGPADQEDRHIVLARREDAGDDKSVASVVAPPAQNRGVLERQRPEALRQMLGHGPAGILHQHHRGNADILDRQAIGLLHLGGTQHAHGWGSYQRGGSSRRVRYPF